MQALLAEGRAMEAVAYAEASRGLNQPDSSIDAECERILLAAGRSTEAYAKYGLTANVSSTGLATFRAIAKKYPDKHPKSILLDLAASSGDPGHWFAAAKSAGLLDLALEFAKTGWTDPRTLSRASRDLLERDATFCLEVGRLAVQRILEGYGYDIAVDDVIDAYRNLMAAARKLEIDPQTRGEVLAQASKANQCDAAIRDVLVRLCAADSRASAVPARAPATRAQRWTKRKA